MWQQFEDHRGASVSEEIGRAIAQDILSGPVGQMVRLVLSRKSGLMIFSTRWRTSEYLRVIREVLRQAVPVQTRLDRFEFLEGPLDSMQALVRAATRGEVLDMGLRCSGAFDAYRILTVLGVPQIMLASDRFLAGVIHVSRVQYLQRPGVPLGEEDSEIERRLRIALSGATSTVRKRRPEDPGVFRWRAEVLAPMPAVSRHIEHGCFQEAEEAWREISIQNGCLPIEERLVIEDIASGAMDPYDYEHEFGPVHWRKAIRDGILNSFEVEAC